ncbi:MAG: hypothetical protein WBN66_03575 [Smithella sp.]
MSEDAPIVNHITSTGQKKCTKCKKELSFKFFCKHTRHKDGLSSLCKQCKSLSDLEYRNNNKEKLKEKCREYHSKNKEIHNLKSKEYHLKNSEKMKKIKKENYDKNKEKNKEKERLRSAKYYKENPEIRRKATYKWNNKNIDKVRSIRRKAMAKKRLTHMGKLILNIKAGISKSIRTGSKNRRHWEDIVGYTFIQLKKHLEKQFLPGMSWENYGRNGWHIDHRIPISAFNFKTPDDHDFKECWKLKNLQPLWAHDNLTKQAKLSKPFQPSLSFGE